MAFLQVLTRCYLRPEMLTANIRSLLEQTDSDWEQTCLIDSQGRGIGWSYENLAAHAPLLRGEYIWILDDDDLCIHPTFIAELRSIAQAYDPDVIMVKMDHGRRGVLPGETDWQQPPQPARIGCSAYIMRRSVWQRHAKAFGSHDAGDFDILGAVLGNMPSVYWHDVIASKVQRISLGAPE